MVCSLLCYSDVAPHSSLDKLTLARWVLLGLKDYSTDDTCKFLPHIPDVAPFSVQYSAGGLSRPKEDINHHHNPTTLSAPCAAFLEDAQMFPRPSYCSLAFRMYDRPASL